MAALERGAGPQAKLGHSTAGSASVRGGRALASPVPHAPATSQQQKKKKNRHGQTGDGSFVTLNPDFYKRIFIERYCVGKSQKTSRSGSKV